MRRRSRSSASNPVMTAAAQVPQRAPRRRPVRTAAAPRGYADPAHAARCSRRRALARTAEATAKIIKKPCPKCGGQGRVRKTRKFKVNIPAGIDDGQSIQQRGQGNAGVNGGPAGDLFVTVAIRPHPIFTRNGPGCTCRYSDFVRAGCTRRYAAGADHRRPHRV